MRTIKAVKQGVVAASIVAAVSTNCLAQTKGEQFDAEKVMNKMTSAERTTYLAGVVEGLAFARYLKDGKQKAGMECIYDWFYEDKTTIRAIHTAFDRFPTYPPGAIIDVMVKRKCGE